MRPTSRRGNDIVSYLAPLRRSQCFYRCFHARLQLYTRRKRRAAAVKALKFRCLAIDGPGRTIDGHIVYPLRRTKRPGRKARRLKLEQAAFDAAVARARGIDADAGDSAGEAGVEVVSYDALVPDGQVGGSGTAPGLASTLGRSLPPLPVSPRTARLRRRAAEGKADVEVPEVLYGSNVVGSMNATCVAVLLRVSTWVFGGPHPRSVRFYQGKEAAEQVRTAGGCCPHCGGDRRPAAGVGRSRAPRVP